MMKPANDDPLSLHDRQVKAITAAVAKLGVQFGPQGFTPEAIFEGAVKGAAVQLIAATDCSGAEVASLLDQISAGLRDVDEDLERPN